MCKTHKSRLKYSESKTGEYSTDENKPEISLAMDTDNIIVAVSLLYSHTTI